jgi:hypothetical protein
MIGTRFLMSNVYWFPRICHVSIERLWLIDSDEGAMLVLYETIWYQRWLRAMTLTGLPNGWNS